MGWSHVSVHFGGSRVRLGERVGEVPSVSDAEFGERGVEVAFDGTYGEVEFGGDLGIAVAGGCHGCDFSFSSAQREEGVCGVEHGCSCIFALGSEGLAAAGGFGGAARSPVALYPTDAAASSSDAASVEPIASYAAAADSAGQGRREVLLRRVGRWRLPTGRP